MLASRIDDRPDASLRVRILKTSRGYSALVAWVDGASRTLEGPTCEGVFEAIVVIGQRAVEDQKSSPPAKVSPPIVPPPLAIADVRAEAPPAAPKEPPPWTHFFGMSFHSTSFMSGRWISGLGWAHDLERNQPLFGVSVLKPSIRIAGSTTFETTVVDLPHVNVDVNRAFAAYVDLCPVTYEALGQPFIAVQLCSRTEIGMLDVEARSRVGSTAVANEHGFWLSTGPVQRIRFGGRSKTGKSPTAFAELSGGLLFPLVRDRFHVAGAPTIVADPITVSFGVGGGVAW